MADETPGKTQGSRAVLWTVGAAFLLFFTLYYAVVASINALVMREVDNRVHNVQGAYEALVGKAADAAWILASRPDTGAAIVRQDRAYLERVCRELLTRVGASTVAVITPAGNVFAGARAPDSEDRFLEGPSASPLAMTQAAGIAEDPNLKLVLYATEPVRSGDRAAGAVVVRLNALSDHSFVDSVRKNFGVVCSVFKKNIRISTTIYQEGKRAIGSPLVNEEILEQVLQNGQVFKGKNRVLGTEYDTVYWPLREVQGRIVGTIGIGRDRYSITWVFGVVAVGALLVIGAVWIILTRRSFRLQSLILLAIVPALLLITCFTGWLLYRNLYAIILEGFNRKLYALSTTISAGLDGDRLLALLETRDAEDPTNRHYLPRLQEILQVKDVTYLYTFILGGKKDIIYLIDASPEEDFCPIGYEEEVPIQNIEGLRQVVGKGIPYISEIQEYERYGLLKVSAAPIFGQNRVSRALAGVDVNITVIKNKTRLALFEILAVGFVALCLAGLISLFVSRRLIEPLVTVKSAALRLAAGQYEHRSAVTEPQETRALSEAFNRVGETMESILKQTAAEQMAAESARQRTELGRKLTRLVEGDSPGAEQHSVLAIRWPGGQAECAEASGGVGDGHAALVWLADSPPDPLAALALRATIADIVRRIIGRHGSDWTAIAAALDNLYRDRVDAFVHWDADRGTVRALVRRPADALLVEAGGQRRAIDLHNDGEILVPAGGSVLLARTAAGCTLSSLIAANRAPARTETDPASLAETLADARQACAAPTGLTSPGPIILLEPRRPA